jgi:predicted permease
MIENLLSDVRYGLRALRKSPGVTVVVVVTIALGIGANAATFSVVNGFLIRPFPAPSPEQLVVPAIAEKGSPLGARGFSYPEFAAFREQARPVCEAFGQVLGGSAALAVDGRSEAISLSGVTSNYFSALEIKPALGRLILPTDGETPGGLAQLVLGHGYWQKRFHSDAGVIGKSVEINGKPAVIVGVVPKEFRGSFAGFEMEGYVPFSTISSAASGAKFWTDRNLRLILAIARLKPGVSIAQLQSSSDVIFGRLAEQYPETDKGFGVRVIQERLARPIPYANNAFIVISALFLALSALVLLLACTNVANILMARSSARAGEMAIRAALGAGRRRRVRQLLTETLLLAALGGIGGLVAAAWSSTLIGSIRLPNLPMRLEAGFDWLVFAYSAGAVLVTAVSVGLSPALAATSSDVNIALRTGGATDPGRTGRHRVHGDLMAVQVAGSLALLVVAGLFSRSLQRAQTMDLGFDPQQVLNVSLDPEQHSYGKAQTIAFYRELERRVRALPGVRSASLASSVPISYFPSRQDVYVEGRRVQAGERPESILFNRVDSEYFETMRIPLLRGRAFRESDDATSAPVAIVNQTMANRFWPGQDPIGERFRTNGESGPFVEVVGVARDGKYRTIGEDPEAYFYVPIAQSYTPALVLQIRGAVAMAVLRRGVEDQIHAVDASMPIGDVETMQESLGGATGLFMFRLGALLAATTGGLGMILAVVGVYGVISYAATKRTREIGIRMALGATPGEILALIVRQGMIVVAAGVATGLAGAWSLSRLMTHLLVGIGASDPAVYGAASVLVAAVALLACWIPARRAARVDPMVALRYE